MVLLEEYGRRYFETAIQFCELVKKSNKGVFPVDLMSLSDEVVVNVIFDVVLQQNNFDLLVFTFLKFSSFECFYDYRPFFENIFRSNNVADNCFFLFCLFKQLNSIFYDEIATMETLFIFGEEEIFNKKMSCKNKVSLFNILQSDFTNVFDSSLLYIKSMPEIEKKEIARYLRYLIFEYGFGGALFLFFLNADPFFLLALKIDAICNDLPEPVILDKSPHIMEATFSDEPCKKTKKRKFNTYR